MPFAATWMDLEIIILCEVSKTEKDKYHMISLIRGILKKNGTNELIFKTEIDPQTQKTNFQLPKGKAGGGTNQAFGINIYTLLYIKQITNKDLPYCAENYIRYFVITYKGKESEKDYIYNKNTLLYT